MGREIVELPIGRVHPSPVNPRRDLGDLTGLAASIRADGILQPLTVVTRDGGWQVVFGHRRLAAAELAGLATVAAEVRELDEGEAAALRLVENLQRHDIDPVEEAGGYSTLVGLGWSRRRIAERVGVDPATVSRRLKLLDLPEGVLGLVGVQLTVGQALELARLADHPDRCQAAAGTIMREPWREPADIVDHQVKVAEAEAAHAAARARAAERDVEVWDGPVHRADTIRDDHLPGTLAVALDELAKIRKVDVDAHRRQPCHAVDIDHRRQLRGGDLEVPVCTNPASHQLRTTQLPLDPPTPEPADQPASDTPEPADGRRTHAPDDRADNAQSDAAGITLDSIPTHSDPSDTEAGSGSPPQPLDAHRARDARLAAARQVVDDTAGPLADRLRWDHADSLARPLLVQLTAAALVDVDDQAVCDLAGLDRTDMPVAVDGTLDLAGWANQADTADLIRVAAAVALVAGDPGVHPPTEWPDPAWARHYDWLADHGHTRGPVDEQLYNAATSVTSAAPHDADQAG